MKDVTPEKREEVTREVFRLFDENHNGVIEREEWLRRVNDGVRLPDFGVRCSVWSRKKSVKKIY